MIVAQPYPDARSMSERWNELAVLIAEKAREGRADELGPKGRLVILGSGISHIDLTADVEAEIRSADHVFYCLYDRLSQMWISRLRPDALDMTVLYDPEIDRYYTYIRMSEALLYHVRRGKKVVAIYYGHPGIFATPTHRAIRIAQREGHSAQMRPGVSALDYLVADLGVDPALPGLLTYEATDMLLRRRVIDPSLHVVLWQVGVVGEFGFAPGGFENRGFDLLIDELERVYGQNWVVTHYIASQYVGVAPLIERWSIQNLRGPDARKNIGALSTFYIEPKEPVATDPERSVALGLSKPGQPVHPPQRQYDSSVYGPQEQAALSSFAVKISPNYTIPRPAQGSEFLFALSEDVNLRELYSVSPERALEDSRFDFLPERIRKLLAIPHPWALSTALIEGREQNNGVVLSTNELSDGRSVS